MPATPLRFDHLALPVYDAARTLHFYTEVLQLPLVDALSGDDWGGKPWLMMFFGTGEGQLLALSALHGAQPPRPDGLPTDVRHYAFSVASATEQEQWKKRLQQHEVPFSEEDHGGQHSIYFSDPNGIVLEVTTPPSSAELQPDAHAAQRVQRWIAALCSDQAAAAK
ncbi:MAG TPA: VOC family protein [Steroidobacteraceae bacterium]|nr:VOC family protein [Steroidobacteraceae bacterium]